MPSVVSAAPTTLMALNRTAPPAGFHLGRRICVPRASNAVCPLTTSCATSELVQKKVAFRHISPSTKAIVWPSGDSAGELARPVCVTCRRVGGADAEGDRPDYLRWDWR